MEIINIAQKLRQSMGKYRWPMLILLLGLCLMLLPTGNEPPETEPVPEYIHQTDETLEQRLESILSQISGAGQVRLLLTERTGSETRYQTDTDTDSDQDGTALRENTVLVESTDRAQNGLIQRIDPPQYLGAVVVCQGGDDPRVKLAVVEAVSCATGLGADQISVMKMK